MFTIIGESGSGKTTLARMILGMVPPSAARIRFRGRDLSPRIRTRRARLAFMRQVQPIFQKSVRGIQSAEDGSTAICMQRRAACRRPTAKAPRGTRRRALRKVGLSLQEVRGRFPHELSGGQLQRVAIARALIPRPALLVADEPVSMVDASLRMAIVNVFRSLRDEMGVSIIYITHDLATAYTISDRIIIMRHGALWRAGPARAVLDGPQHPYSILLKSAVLSPDAAGRGPLTPEHDGEVMPLEQTRNSA